MKTFKLSYLRFMVVTIFLLSLVCGCSDNDDNEPAPAPEKVISFNTYISANLSDKIYPVNKNLSESVFDDATGFNKDLAIVSFAATLQSAKQDKITKFYTDAGFDNIMIKENYDVAETDTVSYSFAHKNIGGYDLVVVFPRSINYRAEWAGNFMIGKSGDHQGFLEAATKVYDEAKNYIEKYYGTAYNEKKLKIWIAGYSRGAGVSNVLSYLILGNDSEKKLDIEQKNVFVYTFGTPRGLTSSHATQFPNVFNFLMESDIVTRVAPVEEGYEFYRCGIDKVFFDCDASGYTEHISRTKTSTTGTVKETRWYTTKVDDALAKLDKDVSLPGFKIQTSYHAEDKEANFTTLKYNTEKEMIDFLFKQLMEKDDTSTGGYSFHTRELYANTVQPHISYAFSLFMSDTSILTELVSKVKGDSGFDINTLFQWIMKEGKFYEDLKSILDNKDVQYNDAELEKTCKAVFDMIDYKTYKGCLTNAIINIMPMAIGDSKDLSRMIANHYSEVIYASLLEYQDS